MADILNDGEGRTHVQVEELEPLSPGVDYGLRNDDGFDPAKYDFYNPSYRTTSKAFVVHLNGDNQTAYHNKDDPHRQPLDPYDVDSPPPLSPIEELDDDPSIHNLRRKSDPGLPTTIELDEPIPDDSVLLTTDKSEEEIEPLEKRSELLFSREHLHLILADPRLSLKFTDFLRTYRPASVTILAYYFDALKALKSIKYAESIIKALEPIPGHDFTTDSNSATMAWVMEDKIDRALDVFMKDDLPAFVAYIYVRTVDVALVERVTGREDSPSNSIADGLAEVFVLSDPSRPDNPIVFTSEEFHRMTGYPRNEFLGRNCRTLGGPRTSRFGINRFRASLDAEREHCEVLLNYRKDGSPFINLIMVVPLRDQSGKIRYYLGAQLDITDLVNECTGLTSFKQLLQRQEEHQRLVNNGDVPVENLQDDEFDQLSQAFNPQELEKLVTIRQRQQLESKGKSNYPDSRNKTEKDAFYRTPLRDLDSGFEINGEGSAPPLGYYKTYLLVRPHPSLRILFASPDLRAPGILQAPLMSRIGGSSRVRDDLAHALEVGRKVTAKVQWLSKTTPKSRPRWIHCTPLLGVNDAIGVWMVILVDDDDEAEEAQPPEIPIQRDGARPGTNYTSEALPWDSERRKVNPGVSTSIWSDTDNFGNRSEEYTRPKPPRRPLFRQPTDLGESSHALPAIRSGPRIAGKAYSFTSTNDGHITADDDSSFTGDRSSRPTTSDSTSLPLKTTMQPKVRIAGRSSMDGEGLRRAPINMPYRTNVDAGEELEGRPPPRRTYKSLSPYGILFED